MMALVRLALRRPLSVAVMALLMLVMGVLSFSLMNVDIFPAINLPVVMRFPKQFYGKHPTAPRRQISFLTTPPTFRWRN